MNTLAPPPPENRFAWLALVGFVVLLLVCGAGGAYLSATFAGQLGLSGVRQLALPTCLGFLATAWVTAMVVFAIDYARSPHDHRACMD